MPPHPPAPRPVPGDGHRAPPPLPEPRPDPRAGNPGAPPAPRPAGPPGGYNPGGPFPPPRRPEPGQRTGSTEGETVRAATAQQPPKTDLSVNKVLAGAGAAATSAVLGSFFGAEGTVVGAAFGSVASTVATTLYQRSLDRTRDTLVAVVRVRRNPGDRTDQADPELTVRLPPVGPDGSVEPDLAEQPPPRRRWWLWVGLTVLAFALAMAVITGIELAKGSTITGNESGTSIGRAAEPKPAAPVEDEPGTTETDTTATPEPTEDADSSTTATPDPDAPGGAEGDSERQQDEEQAPEDDPGGSVDIRPTEQDVPGDEPASPDSDSGPGAGAGTGGAGSGDR